MNSVKVSKDELRTILETLNRFHDINSDITIVTGSTSDRSLEILFNTIVNDIPGVFKINLAISHES